MKFKVGDVVKIVNFYGGRETPYGPNRFEVIEADPEAKTTYTLRWLRPERDLVFKNDLDLALVEDCPTI